MAVLAGAWPGSGSRRAGIGSWLIGIIIFSVLSLLFSFISNLLQPGPVSCKPPQCTLPPPKQGPLTAPKIYTGSRYGFSVDYSTNNIQPSTMTATSISWQGTLSDGSDVSWSLTGMPANGRTPQQIVEAKQTAQFPDAQQDYTVPDATIGYTIGYGNVYDVTVSPADGESEDDRLLIFSAIRNGLAVVMVGLGPYEQSSPGNDAQPNPAGTSLVELGDFEENLNSVTWPGQQPF